MKLEQILDMAVRVVAGLCLFGIVYSSVRLVLRRRKSARCSRDYSLTLQPGESAYADIELPPVIQDMVRAGGRLQVKQPPLVNDGDGSYHRDLIILVDDVEQGRLRAAWRL